MTAVSPFDTLQDRKGPLMKLRSPLVVASLSVLLAVLELSSPFPVGASRLQECLKELSIRGGISAPDVVSEGDPFFHHVGFHGRDEDENVFYGEPKFFLFRPAHAGGILRFDLHAARTEDRPFYGGRFKIRFGKLETIVVDVSLERDRERLALLDAESRVHWKTYGSPRQVRLTIPPGEESIDIEWSGPGGGTFFLAGLSFEPTPMGAQVVLSPSGKRMKAGAGVSASPGPSGSVSRAAVPATASSPPTSTEPSIPLERLEALTREQGRHLKELETLLERARTKRSGHPAFLDALAGNLAAQRKTQKKMEGLSRNPDGYGW